LSSPEITLIVDSRQVGETTLMEILRDDLEKNGKKTIFLNLDFDADRLFFESQDRLLQKTSYEIGTNGGMFLLMKYRENKKNLLFQ